MLCCKHVKVKVMGPDILYYACIKANSILLDNASQSNNVW